MENSYIETKPKDSIIEEEKNIDILNSVNEEQKNRKNMFLKK